MRSKSIISLFKNFKTTATYIIASGIQKLGHLLLLPLLVISLSNQEFTRYGLFTSVIALLPSALSLNIQISPSRLYFDYTNQNDKDYFLSVTLIISILLTLILSLIIYLSFIYYSITDPVTDGSKLNLILVLGCIVLLVGIQHCLQVYRVKGKVKNYTLIVSIQSFTILISYIIYVYILNISPFKSIITSYFTGTLLAFTYGRLNSHFKIEIYDRYEFKYLKDALIFSWPTVVHALMIWIIPSSGRWFGINYYSLEELSSYILLMQIIMAVTIFSRAVYDAKIPEIGISFSKFEYNSGYKILRNGHYLSIILISVSYIGIYVIFNSNLKIFDSYELTNGMLLLGLLSNIFDAHYLKGIQLLNALKRTIVQAKATLIAGFFTLLITPLLLSNFGILGLLLATVLGYLSLSLITNYFAIKEFNFVKEL